MTGCEKEQLVFTILWFGISKPNIPAKVYIFMYFQENIQPPQPVFNR